MITLLMEGGVNIEWAVSYPCTEEVIIDIARATTGRKVTYSIYQLNQGRWHH